MFHWLLTKEIHSHVRSYHPDVESDDPRLRAAMESGVKGDSAFAGRPRSTFAQV